jgi:hypothetical protein
MTPESTIPGVTATAHKRIGSASGTGVESRTQQSGSRE